MERKHITIDISTRTIISVIAAVACVVLFWQIRQILLLIFTAVVLAALVTSGAALFQRIRIPRIWAITLTYLIFLGIIFLVFYFAVPVFAREIVQFIDLFPARSQAGKSLAPIGDFINSAGNLGSIATAKDPISTISSIWTQFTSVGFAKYAGQVIGTVANTILVFVISFYLAASDRGVDAFLRAVTPVEYEKSILRLWHRTEIKIGLWFRGQVLQALILGLVTYIGLVLLGIPYALLLALLAFVLDFIPFGIILGTIPAVILAYMGGGLGLALIVSAFYIIVQQLENYILAPYIVRKSTGVPSIVVLLALLIGTQVAGVLGLILAIPVSVFLMEVIKDREAAKKRTLES